jgi:Flp pilus assembly protein TadB
MVVFLLFLFFLFAALLAAAAAAWRRYTPDTHTHTETIQQEREEVIWNPTL